MEKKSRRDLARISTRYPEITQSGNQTFIPFLSTSLTHCPGTPNMKPHGAQPTHITDSLCASVYGLDYRNRVTPLRRDLVSPCFELKARVLGLSPI